MTAWRRHLVALGLVWAALLLAFARDAAHLGGIWWNSSTFTHCLLIPPIIAWLVWLRRHELAKLHPRPWLPGLFWIAGGALLWMAGDAASVALARHAGLVLMLQGCVPALLGPRVARGLAFPLFYALFMIPFGEELVPPMQIVTADMAMALLRMNGIPAHIEGIFITTPGGYFAVAEACSGVKFLIAMAALAVLAAHLCFRSWKRRIAFLAFAMIVPILANGVRAWSTIWIAEHWGREFAIGADHLIYGWIFFALVIALVGAAAAPFFDRSPEDVPISAERLAAMPAGRALPLAPAALAALAIAMLPVALDRLGDATADALPAIASPAVPGWTPLAGASADGWTARFDGADAREDWRFIGESGDVVEITLAGFARQGENAELVGFGQGAVDSDGDWAWGERLAPLGRARVDRIALAGRNRDVLTLYLVGGEATASPARVKLLTLKARLGGGDERAWALLVSARQQRGRDGRSVIADFVASASGAESLARRLTQARGTTRNAN